MNRYGYSTKCELVFIPSFWRFNYQPIFMLQLFENKHTSTSLHWSAVLLVFVVNPVMDERFVVWSPKVLWSVGEMTSILYTRQPGFDLWRETEGDLFWMNIISLVLFFSLRGAEGDSHLEEALSVSPRKSHHDHIRSEKPMNTVLVIGLFVSVVPDTA